METIDTLDIPKLKRQGYLAIVYVIIPYIGLKTNQVLSKHKSQESALRAVRENKFRPFQAVYYL